MGGGWGGKEERREEASVSPSVERKVNDTSMRNPIT